MMLAYTRRKQWEAAIMAGAMYGNVAQSRPGTQQAGNREVIGTAKNGDVYITGDAMLAQMGFM